MEAEVKQLPNLSPDGAVCDKSNKGLDCWQDGSLCVLCLHDLVWIPTCRSSKVSHSRSQSFCNTSSKVGGGCFTHRWPDSLGDIWSSLSPSCLTFSACTPASSPSPSLRFPSSGLWALQVCHNGLQHKSGLAFPRGCQTNYFATSGTLTEQAPPATDHLSPTL